MSSPHDTAPGNGLGELRGRKERRRRTPPPPRHPAAPAESAAEATTENATVESTHETTREIPREIARPSADQQEPRQVEAPAGAEASTAVETPSSPAAPAVTPAPQPDPAGRGPRPEVAPGRRQAEPSASPSRHGREAQPGPASGPPTLAVDVDDASAMIVTPTVLSIGGSIMRRFEAARPSGASHTALVLDALRAHVNELPRLVERRRPEGRPGDLFPWRGVPGEHSKDRPEPLRIRPTAGELAVMDALVTWVNSKLRHSLAGARKASRSEVVAAALDAFLPAVGRKR